MSAVHVQVSRRLAVGRGSADRVRRETGVVGGRWRSPRHGEREHGQPVPARLLGRHDVSGRQPRGFGPDSAGVFDVTPGQWKYSVESSPRTAYKDSFTAPSGTWSVDDVAFAAKVVDPSGILSPDKDLPKVLLQGLPSTVTFGALTGRFTRSLDHPPDALSIVVDTDRVQIDHAPAGSTPFRITAERKK